MSGEKFNLVVVVDDDIVYLDTVALMLHTIGFKQIKTYENGLDAIDAIENDRPDLVISDWDMPIMTGIDLLMCVRNDPDLVTVPFILNTGHLEQARRTEAIRCGVTEFLAKPFGFKGIKAIVLRAMDQVDEADREEVFAAKRAS